VLRPKLGLRGLPLRTAGRGGKRLALLLATTFVLLATAATPVPFSTTPSAFHDAPARLGSAAPATLAASASVAGPPPGPAIPGLHSPLPAAGTPRASFSSVRMGSFHVPGPHPQSWHGASVPPGAPFPVGWSPAKPADSTNESGSLSSPVFSSGHCAGLYPITGNKTYYDNCVGHDEPGIQFYSNLPGSAGNWTWNVTLPIGSGPSRNQSNLYVAVWFGLTLSDPLAWMNQCFLELQFYPDSSFSGSTEVSGQWVGAAVAWQIEAATGYEDPCYYSELYNNGIPGPGVFNMTQGDRLTVTMSGWPTSPYGENLTVVDHTSRQRSNLTLFDPYGNFPLNPAYSTNSFENGLQWTPGGEYPAVFAFETGHGRNPSYPSNTSFDYCTPGRPPATFANPYVPCAGYDPASWVNDSRQPWRIGVPTFFSGSTTQRPAQVSFTQDLGGIGYVDSFPGCPGNEGSTYCSYPWYSYSCVSHSFQFGATDWPGTARDFGQYHQYATRSETNNLGLGYYPPTNFTMPACGDVRASVGLGVAGPPGGLVNFLSQTYGTATTVPDLALGGYSLHAIGTVGAEFSSWTTSGNVRVDLPTSAWATLVVAGDGAVTAHFAAAPPTTLVVFHDSVASASVAVFSNYLQTPQGVPLAILPSDGAISLASQIYAVQALPPPGYNFTRWTSTGPGVVVAASEFPDSWLVVTGNSTNETVTAWYTATTSQAQVIVQASGGGTVTFNGSTSTYVYRLLPVGTYPVSATPGAGWTFSDWTWYGSVLLPDLRSSTNVSLENGTTYLTAVFAPLPANLTIRTTPSTGGTVSLFPPARLANGTVVPLSTGFWSVTAVPATGFAFTGWSVNLSAAGWVSPATAADASLELNASVTLTAQFTAATLVSLSFHVFPVAGGTVEFNLGFYSDGTTNSSVSNGSYDFQLAPAPGYSVLGAVTSGPVTISGSEILVAGTGGAVTASFSAIAPTLYPVTFVSAPGNASTATLNGTPMAHGDTVWLIPGSYPISVTTVVGDTFVGWSSAGGVSESNATANTTTLVVTGGGTAFAIAADFYVNAELLSPNPVDVNTSFVMHASALGPGQKINYTWTGLPPPCGGSATVPVNFLYCTPNATGSYAIGLNDSDALGANVVVPPMTLTVVGPPRIATFHASRTSFDLGVATTISVGVVGGVGPYSYFYTGLPFGCLPRNASTISCTPGLLGRSTVNVSVVDSQTSGGTASLNFTVHTGPSVSKFVTQLSPVTEFVPTSFSVTVANGTAPFSYSYSGLPAGCPSSDTAQLMCQPTVAGSFDVRVNATDADGVTVGSQSFLLVNPTPSVATFTAAPASIQVGFSTTLTVSVSGGTAPFRYAYTGLPPGCTSENRSTFLCQPSDAGNFTVGVTVSDKFGQNATGAVDLTALANTTAPGPGGSGGPAPPSVSYLVLIEALLGAVVVGGVAGTVVGRRRPPPKSPPADEVDPDSAAPNADAAASE
jgi:hypothetical protein